MCSEQAQLLICQVYYDKLARKDWKWNATVFVECTPFSPYVDDKSALIFPLLWAEARR